MLHCGACGEKFDESNKLTYHIDNDCPAQKMLHAYNNIIINDSIGHNKARLFVTAHRNKYLIDKYAMAISTEMGSVERAKIHSELCDALGLSYSEFKPFESNSIEYIPSFNDCRRIIYDAIADKIINYSK